MPSPPAAYSYDVVAAIGCILLDDGRQRLDRLRFDDDRLLEAGDGVVALISRAGDHVVRLDVEVLDRRPDSRLALPATDDWVTAADSCTVELDPDVASPSLRLFDLRRIRWMDHDPIPVGFHKVLVEAVVERRPDPEWLVLRHSRGASRTRAVARKAFAVRLGGAAEISGCDRVPDL